MIVCSASAAFNAQATDTVETGIPDGRVDVEQRGPGQGDCAGRVAGQVGRLGGVLQHRDTIEPSSGFGIGDLVPQRERGLEVPLRLVTQTRY